MELALRPTDNENHSIDKGPADFDTRHRVVATVSYELPFMKGNRFLGGWGMNTIVSYQTGHPWTPFGGNAGAADKNKDGYRTDRILPNDHGVPTGSIESTEISGSPAFGTLDRSKWGFNPDTNTFSYFTCPASVNDGLMVQRADRPQQRLRSIGCERRLQHHEEVQDHGEFRPYVPGQFLRPFQSPELPESDCWQRRQFESYETVISARLEQRGVTMVAIVSPSSPCGLISRSAN